MLEPAIARELPPGESEADDDVVVLDDVTPCYLKANAALNACKAGLGIALHFLLDTEASDDLLAATAAQQARLMAHTAPGNGGPDRRIWFGGRNNV